MYSQPIYRRWSSIGSVIAGDMKEVELHVTHVRTGQLNPKPGEVGMAQALNGQDGGRHAAGVCGVLGLSLGGFSMR